MNENNKAVVRRFYSECLNTGDLSVVPHMVAEDFIGGRGERGPAEYAKTLERLRAGFPDAKFVIEDMVAEGDRVAVRFRMEGTHLGAFAGTAASGKAVNVTSMVIYRVESERIARAWLLSDSLGLMQQIGALPKPA